MKKIFVALLTFLIVGIVTLCSVPTRAMADNGTFEEISLNLPSHVEAINWKPDGSYALIVGGKDLFGGNPVHERFVVKYDGVQLIELLNESFNDNSYHYLTDVAWKPDGSYALIIGVNGTVLRYDGTNFHTFDTSTNNPLWSIAWKPDGSYALIVGYGTILTYDGVSFTNVSNVPQIQLWEVSWKPDGSYALITTGLDQIIKYDGSVTAISTFPTGLTNYSWEHIAWKPDGSYALITGQWFIVYGPYQSVITYNGTNFEIINDGIDMFLGEIAWKPDGSCALIGDEAFLRYDLLNITRIQSTYDADCISWKSDGSYLLFGSGKKVVKYTPTCIVKPIYKDWFWVTIIILILVTVLIAFAMGKRPKKSEKQPHSEPTKQTR